MTTEVVKQGMVRKMELEDSIIGNKPGRIRFSTEIDLDNQHGYLVLKFDKLDIPNGLDIGKRVEITVTIKDDDDDSKGETRTQTEKA